MLISETVGFCVIALWNFSYWIINKIYFNIFILINFLNIIWIFCVSYIFVTCGTDVFYDLVYVSNTRKIFCGSRCYCGTGNTLHVYGSICVFMVLVVICVVP